MTTKYRVRYDEHDGTWSFDTWNTDYATEAEAQKAFEDCWNRHMTKKHTPEYYVRPYYIGAVEVKES